MKKKKMPTGYLSIEEVDGILRDEIDWHIHNKIKFPDVSYEYAMGYLGGIMQARYLLKEFVRVVENKE